MTAAFLIRFAHVLFARASFAARARTKRDLNRRRLYARRRVASFMRIPPLVEQSYLCAVLHKSIETETHIIPERRKMMVVPPSSTATFSL